MKFYITTSIAYVNAPPHIGYALELAQADVLARYHRLLGDDVRFLTGTDEHGTKIAKAAEAASLSPQEFTDKISAQFQKLCGILNISNNDFIRTSDEKRHWPAAQKLWRELAERGDLYKKNYEGLYCVGHEAFMKKSDLKDGVCPLHKTKPEKIEEENWFFKLTSYKKQLKKIVESDELQILPASRKSEVLNLLDDAEDISFSRPSEKIKWGIPVPGDATQTMYVWADALTNYISALDYGIGNWKLEIGNSPWRFWPADIHLVGKDILRFHAIIWPAMLLSASLPLPQTIAVHGFITVDGEKMSKTVGNVVDPFKMIEKYGGDVIRYYLLREIPSDEDGDFSEEKLKERYNGDLANGLGNLVQRVATLIENGFSGKFVFDSKTVPLDLRNRVFDINGKRVVNIENFKLHEALTNIWDLIKYANVYFDTRRPWETRNSNPTQFNSTMIDMAFLIYHISEMLEPFMPETSDKIQNMIGFKLESSGGSHKLLIKKIDPLFPRLIN